MLSRNEILKNIDIMNTAQEEEYKVSVLPVRMSIKEYLMFTGICNIYKDDIKIDKLLPEGEYCVVEESIPAESMYEMSFKSGDMQPLVLLTDYDAELDINGLLVNSYALGMNPKMFYEFDNYKKLIRDNIKRIYIGYVELVQDLSEYEAAYSDICASIDELDYDSLKKEILGRNWDYSNIPDEFTEKIKNVWSELDNCITRTISKMCQINPKVEPIFNEIYEEMYGIEAQNIPENKLYEKVLKKINVLSNKMDTLLLKIEQLEQKYAGKYISEVIEEKASDEKNHDTSYIDTDVFIDAIKKGDEELGLAQMDDNVLRLAERVYNAWHRDNHLDENQRIAVINSIAGKLENGAVEEYMDILNGILVTESLSQEDYSIIEGVVEDLANYNYDNKEYEDAPEQDKNMGGMNEEPKNGIRHMGSGNIFINWVNTQSFDIRIKNAFASIEYVFDEITRSDNNLLVSNDNIIGLENNGVVKMYDDGKGKNKISNFLIDVNNILKGSIHETAVRECYDIVRAVEREELKAKKTPQR